MQIRFTEKAVYRQNAGDVVHEAGDVLDCPEDYAWRWIRRGVAERVEAGPAVAAPDAASAAAEALQAAPKGKK